MDVWLKDLPSTEEGNKLREELKEAFLEVGDSNPDYLFGRWLERIYDNLSLETFTQALERGWLSWEKVSDFLPLAFSKRKSGLLQVLWDFDDSRSELFTNVFYDLLLYYGLYEEETSLLRDLSYILPIEIAFYYFLVAALVNFDQGALIMQEKFQFENQSLHQLFSPSFQGISGKYLPWILQQGNKRNYFRLLKHYLEVDNYEAADVVFDFLRPSTFEEEWNPHLISILQHSSNYRWVYLAIEQGKDKEKEVLSSLFGNPRLRESLLPLYDHFLRVFSSRFLYGFLGERKVNGYTYQWGLKYLWAQISDKTLLEKIIARTEQEFGVSTLPVEKLQRQFSLPGEQVEKLQGQFSLPDFPWLKAQGNGKECDFDWKIVALPRERLQFIQNRLGLESDYEELYLLPGQHRFFSNYRGEEPWLVDINQQLDMILSQNTQETSEEIRTRIIKVLLSRSEYYREIKNLGIFFFSINE